MLDDLLVGARGARVRCTECGTVFRVTPATGGSLAELGASLPAETWRVNRVNGQQLQFSSVSDLSRAILSGQVVENDVLSRGLLPARRLGEVLELNSFFARARRPDPDERIPTLPGLADPAQRAAVERARAEIERLQREATAVREPAVELAPETEPTPAPVPVHVPAAIEPAAIEPTPDEGVAAPAPIPEAAVSPPTLPDVDDGDTDPPAPLRQRPPDSDRAEATPRLASASDRRRARIRHGVMSLLAAAAIVLVAGLGAHSLRLREQRSVAASTPSVAPVVSALAVLPEPTVVPEPLPVAELLPAAESSALAVVPSAAPAASGSSETHRGDPQTLPPVDPRRMVADGARALRHGELTKAEDAFKRAISKNPYDSEALSGLGDLARVRGQNDKAREIYAQVLSVNPSYLPALLSLGDLAWATGDRTEAVKNYEYIVSHYPESAYPARVKQRAGEEAPQ